MKIEKEANAVLVGERINEYRRQAGMTIDELARRSGVSRGTLNKIVGGETKSPTLAVMDAIARALGRTLNDFAEDGGREMSDEARSLAMTFDGLDLHGKRVVRSVAGEEKRRMAAKAAAEKPAMKVIPLFGNSFAAGRGDPDFGNPWEDYPVPADSAADFAVRVNGDSMEPYLPDGSVALGVKRAPRDGEVAALLVDGEFLCKQVCQDMLGNLYLFALNRKRRDADQTIARDSERSVSCFGTILMERVGLPTDV